MLISKDTVLSKKCIPWRAIGNEVIIMDVAKSEVFDLNETAKDIWETIDGVRTVAEISRHLGQTYEVTPEMALGDTLTLVKRFYKQGWLIAQTPLQNR